jgi:hypothetical protein
MWDGGYHTKTYYYFDSKMLRQDMRVSQFKCITQTIKPLNVRAAAP